MGSSCSKQLPKLGSGETAPRPVPEPEPEIPKPEPEHTGPYAHLISAYEAGRDRSIAEFKARESDPKIGIAYERFLGRIKERFEALAPYPDRYGLVTLMEVRPFDEFEDTGVMYDEMYRHKPIYNRKDIVPPFVIRVNDGIIGCHWKFVAYLPRSR